MGRRASFQGSTKAVAATTAQTIVFTPQDIDSAGLVQLMFGWSGSGNANVDIDRIRVRAGGDILYDAPWADIQAYQQRYARNHTANASAGTAFSIPLNLLDAPTQETMDKMQYPPNREIQVEVVTLNTTVAGTLMAGWVTTDVAPEFWMKLYSSVLNLSASTSNGRYPYVEGGILRGLVLPLAGIQRAELFVSGRSAWRLSGADFGGVATGDMLREKDRFEDGTTVTTRTCLGVDLNLPAAPGSSYLLLDTGSGWSGVAEFASFFSVVPLAKAA